MGGLLVPVGCTEQRLDMYSPLRLAFMCFAALERGIPIVDPSFYGDSVLCPDSLLEEIFKPADGCAETMPLLRERISIMRQIGKIFVEVSALH